MVKYILIFVIGGLLGTAAGFALGIFVYPYIFLADIVAMEKVERPGARKVVATGTFIHANPSDPIHYGKGSQNYAIPAGIDLSRYETVVIWCEQFSVLVSPAALKRF